MASEYEFDPIRFGSRLREAVAKRELTIRGAAEAIGVSQTTLHRTMHGGVPNARNYAKMNAWIERPKGKS